MTTGRGWYQRRTAKALSALAASALAVLTVWGPAKPRAADRAPVIVQARDLATAATAVRVGGRGRDPRAGDHRRGGRDADACQADAIRAGRT